jgi:hypothetical protein
MLKYVIRAFCYTIFLITGGENMLNVFVKKSAEELHIQLSDGRMIPLDDLIRDYERLLKEAINFHG